MSYRIQLPYIKIYNTANICRLNTASVVIGGCCWPDALCRITCMAIVVVVVVLPLPLHNMYYSTK